MFTRALRLFTIKKWSVLAWPCPWKSLMFHVCKAHNCLSYVAWTVLRIELFVFMSYSSTSDPLLQPHRVNMDALCAPTCVLMCVCTHVCARVHMFMHTRVHVWACQIHPGAQPLPACDQNHFNGEMVWASGEQCAWLLTSFLISLGVSDGTSSPLSHLDPRITTSYQRTLLTRALVPVSHIKGNHRPQVLGLRRGKHNN